MEHNTYFLRYLSLTLCRWLALTRAACLDCACVWGGKFLLLCLYLPSQDSFSSPWQWHHFDHSSVQSPHYTWVVSVSVPPTDVPSSRYDLPPSCYAQMLHALDAQSEHAGGRGGGVKYMIEPWYCAHLGTLSGLCYTLLVMGCDLRPPLFQLTLNFLQHLTCLQGSLTLTLTEWEGGNSLRLHISREL